MEQFLAQNSWILAPLAIWSLTWKGLALWKAAGLKHKWWFITIFLVNTIGFLDLLYIFIFSERKKAEKTAGPAGL